jgi:myo-inositol-1(or 4)-monophosphatase
MGRLDLFFEGLSPTSGPKPWDFGAAQLIVSEAGGVCLDINGEDFDMTSGRILCASTQKLARQAVEILN